MNDTKRFWATAISVAVIGLSGLAAVTFFPVPDSGIAKALVATAFSVAIISAAIAGYSLLFLDEISIKDTFKYKCGTDGIIAGGYPMLVALAALFICSAFNSQY